ncbi:20S proteasome subunit beta 4 [Nematocida sp. AWRm80]|nr:20S proteasome subunit beta 4 [Nematocida sp. AWRm80]
MDALFGVVTKEGVLLASDRYFRNNVIITKSDHIRYKKITDKAAVISAGDQGDCMRVIQEIIEVLKYESLANSIDVQACTFTSLLQKKIHTSLRSGPVNVQALVGGIDNNIPTLFMVDNYGAVSSSKYMATGYASHFFLSAMDMHYSQEMTKDQAKEVIKEVYNGIRKRMVINYGHLHFCTITENGVLEEV